MSNQEKERIKEFLRKNPNATYRDIKKKLNVHLERVYKDGMGEAFKEAGVEPPRTLKRKTKEERRKIIIDYIKKNPLAGWHNIKKDTKINIASAFKSIKEAYNEAEIKYPREESYRESADKKKEKLIKILKENPRITVIELMKDIRTNPYRFFKSINELYEKAGVKKLAGNDKRKIRKRQMVINFIKENPFATQREINKSCKTHVQELFKKGIFDAYEQAGVKFPYERLKEYGIGLKEIRQRAKTFEDNIAIKLSGFGKVNRLVKTKRGFADIIFERKNKKAVIEIKDYELKDISVSQVEQLNKYLEDCNCNLGFLICYKKPKKDSFLIGKNKIFILEEDELSKIAGLIDGTVVQQLRIIGSRKIRETD